MPHEPTAPPGLRFFARVDRFHCECPSCGAIIVAHKDPQATRSSSALRRRRATQYNPITARLTCPVCRKVYGVGLLLWPLARGGNRNVTPADQRPTRRQLRQLAQYAYGLWADQIRKQGEELNIAIDQECRCPQSAGGWNPSCPIHGWDEFMRRQDTLEEPELPPIEPLTDCDTDPEGEEGG